MIICKIALSQWFLKVPLGYCLIRVFLGAFAKLQKATVGFVMSAHLPSALQYETTRLLLDRFSWNSIFCHFFENLFTNFKFYWNRTRITATLHEDQYTFLIISRSFLLRMRNVSDKSRIENQNTHCIISNFLSENRAANDIVWKIIVEPERPQMRVWRICIACLLPKATKTNTYTQNM